MPELFHADRHDEADTSPPFFLGGGGGDAPINEVACNCFIWKTVQSDSLILGTGAQLCFSIMQRAVISTSWEVSAGRHN
jgi:hypothetical protein